MNDFERVVKISIVLISFVLFACAGKPDRHRLDDESIPIAERYAEFNKRQLNREREQVKERIYDEYNKTAKREDVIICGMERVRDSRTRRQRVCTTRKHREEMTTAAKGEYCIVCGAEVSLSNIGNSCGCDESVGTMNNRLVHHRAAQQMQRINKEIKEMAKQNPVLKKLLLKLNQLNKLYLTKYK